MSELNLYFRLYSSCNIVKGSLGAILVDLDRKNIYEIPSLLFDLLDKTYDFSIGEIKKQNQHQYDEGLDAYLNQFVELGLGFFTKEPDAFPKLNLIWDSPLEIQTAILEVKNLKIYDIKSVMQQLDELGCAAIQFRFLNKSSFNEISKVISHAKLSRIKSIELYIHESGFSNDELLDIVEIPRVQLLVISGVRQKSISHLSSAIKNHAKIFFSKQKITFGEKDVVNLNNFVLDIRTFSESQIYNIALNRKISIDWQGNIKNYPAHDAFYGNVLKDDLIPIVKSEKFREKWTISNDQIEKCKSCQYRYVCFFNSDLKKQNGKWIKMEDCGFNPITNKWSSQK